jgi:integrase
MGQDADGSFVATGVAREAWTTAGPIRGIFREAFETAGLPYFKPHSIRDTLAQFGERTCRTPEEFKAWSQNLGHENVLTTFRSYGAVAPHRQAELIRGLHAGQGPEPELAELLKAALAKIDGPQCAR